MTHRRNFVGHFILAGFPVALLLACQTTSPPQVRSDSAPGVDFAALRTYGFHKPLSTDDKGYSTLTTAHIKAAVEDEMAARGIVASESPDLLVNFDVATNEGVASSAKPSVGVSYGGFTGGGLGMGLGMSTGGGVKSVTEGTLTIDIVDRARNQLDWSGSAVGTLSQKDLSDPQKLIDSAVLMIFEKYPKPPVSLAPAGT